MRASKRAGVPVTPRAHPAHRRSPGRTTRSTSARPAGPATSGSAAARTATSSAVGSGPVASAPTARSQSLTEISNRDALAPSSPSIWHNGSRVEFFVCPRIQTTESPTNPGRITSRTGPLLCKTGSPEMRRERGRLAARDKGHLLREAAAPFLLTPPARQTGRDRPAHPPRPQAPPGIRR